MDSLHVQQFQFEYHEFIVLMDNFLSITVHEMCWYDGSSKFVFIISSVVEMVLRANLPNYNQKPRNKAQFNVDCVPNKQHLLNHTEIETNIFACVWPTFGTSIFLFRRCSGVQCL